MIKLKDILLESKASEEAKRKGLTHTSFGRYADKSGKIVAMSRNGKLVMLNGGDETSRIKTMKVVEPKKSNPAAQRIYDRWVEKRKATFSPGNKNKLDMPGFIFDEDLPEGTKIEYYEGSLEKYNKDHYYRDSQYYSMMDKETRDKVHKALPTEADDADRRLGDTLLNLRGRDVQDADSKPVRIEGRRNSYQQHKNWRSKLSKNVNLLLAAITYEWQNNAQYKWRERDPAASAVRNRFLNDVMEGKHSDGKPAKVKMVDGPLGGAMERGIKIEGKDVYNFLQNFKPGTTVSIPPCGWSLISTTARQFSDTGNGRYAGVIMRVKPKGKSDEMVGLALSDVRKWAIGKESGKPFNGINIDYISKNFGSEINQMGFHNPTAFQAYINNTRDAVGDNIFDWETEVITPGWMGYKVLSVTKHVIEDDTKSASNPGYPRTYFEIEMEEVGRVSDDLVKEAKSKKTGRLTKILYKYMLGSLHDPKKEKQNGKENRSPRR